MVALIFLFVDNVLNKFVPMSLPLLHQSKSSLNADMILESLPIAKVVKRVVVLRRTSRLYD